MPAQAGVVDVAKVRCTNCVGNGKCTHYAWPAGHLLARKLTLANFLIFTACLRQFVGMWGIGYVTSSLF